jgi:hypothetical protein
LVIAATVPFTYPATSQITVIDPTAGTVIWQSPSVLGTVPINSLSFHDYNANGQLEMAFGTSQAMYVTR